MNPFKDITDKHDADVELLHPVTRNPLGAAITIAGPEHPKRKSILADRARRIRRKLERTGKLKLDDPETEEADRIELLAGCTLGWSGLTGEDGTPLPFSTEAAADLYTRVGWIRAQMEAAFDDRDLFIQDSSSTSSTGRAASSS